MGRSSPRAFAGRSSALIYLTSRPACYCPSLSCELTSWIMACHRGPNMFRDGARWADVEPEKPINASKISTLTDVGGMKKYYPRTSDRGMQP